MPVKFTSKKVAKSLSIYSSSFGRLTTPFINSSLTTGSSSALDPNKVLTTSRNTFPLSNSIFSTPGSPSALVGPTFRCRTGWRCSTACLRRRNAEKVASVVPMRNSREDVVMSWKLCHHDRYGISMELGCKMGRERTSDLVLRVVLTRRRILVQVYAARGHLEATLLEDRRRYVRPNYVFLRASMLGILAQRNRHKKLLASQPGNQHVSFHQINPSKGSIA